MRTLASPDSTTMRAEAPFPVWADGSLHAPGTRVVSAEDEGFLLGLSVYDTLLLEDGTLYFVEEHLARLRRGAQELAIPWPPPWDPRAAMKAMVDALGGRDAAVRLTLTRGVPGEGSSLIVTARSVAVLPPEGVAVFVASLRKLGGHQLEGVKSTNRLRNVLAREEAQAHGAWEALLLNHEGDVSEGTISNLWIVCDGRLWTPPIERGCLSGIVREKILATLAAEPLKDAAGRTLPVCVERMDAAELARADEAFLSNSTGRVIPIVAIRGLPGGEHRVPGREGPWTAAVRERVRKLEAAYRAAHPRPGPPR